MQQPRNNTWLAVTCAIAAAACFAAFWLLCSALGAVTHWVSP